MLYLDLMMLNTQTCESPCQMRRVTSLEAPGINQTMADIAIATLESEVDITEHVGVTLLGSSLHSCSPISFSHSNIISKKLEINIHHF